MIRTVATAGRAVFFSGLTVAVSLSALLVFPIAFLRSFAYAGVPVVALAVIGAVVLLPAGLAVLGDRINKFSLPHRKRERLVVEGTFWWRSANVGDAPTGPVRRRRRSRCCWCSAFRSSVSPSGCPTIACSPPRREVRQVNDEIRDDYGSNDAAALAVVLPNVDMSAQSDEVERLRDRAVGTRRRRARRRSIRHLHRRQSGARRPTAGRPLRHRRRHRHVDLGGAVRRTHLGRRVSSSSRRSERCPRPRAASRWWAAPPRSSST